MSSLRFILPLLFAGCASTPPAEPQKPLFALATTAEGQVYRTNTQTGEVFKVAGNELVKLGEHSTSIVLEIGKKYFIEGHRSMVYLGNGRFSEPKEDFEQLWQ